MREYFKKLRRLLRTISRENEELETIERVFDGPVISVIMPIYDRTDLLKSAIDSVLNQEYESYELILVCDGSPAETIEVVKSYLWHPQISAYFLEGNSGNAVRGRNVGIAKSKGKYIAFLDSDDICAIERFSISVAILENDEADVVYGSWIAMMDGTRKIDGLEDGQLVHSLESNFEELLEICIPCQSTVTLRKEFLNISGLIKPEMKYREDHELWLRLAFFGAKFKNVKYPFTKLRLHSGNNELNFKDNSAFWLRMTQNNYMKPGPTVDNIIDLLPDD